jgi:protein-tyrosine phosphatase
VAHPRLPANARLWGASRPGYPDVPATPRQIESAVREWVGAGVDVVVTLMEDEELARICPGFLDAIRRHELESLHFPIRDFGAPEPNEASAFCALVDDVRARLARGQGVLVHCNAGQGRTAVFLASLLKGCGHPGDAVEEIRRVYYGDAMRGVSQEAFVRKLAFGPNGRGPMDDGAGPA